LIPPGFFGRPFVYQPPRETRTVKCITLTPLTISGKSYKAGQSIDLPETRARRLASAKLVSIDGEDAPKRAAKVSKPAPAAADPQTDPQPGNVSATEGSGSEPKTAAKPKATPKAKSKAVAKPATKARAKGGGKATTE
jgi:hypothetical protein